MVFIYLLGRLLIISGKVTDLVFSTKTERKSLSVLASLTYEVQSSCLRQLYMDYFSTVEDSFTIEEMELSGCTTSGRGIHFNMSEHGEHKDFEDVEFLCSSVSSLW